VGSKDDGLQVLLIQVHHVTQVVTYRGVPYERVLNTTRVMPRAGYLRLLVESIHSTDRWEIQPAWGCTLDTLDRQELMVTIEEGRVFGAKNQPSHHAPKL
jgi:ATP-dependent DNA helicase RecG